MFNKLSVIPLSSYFSKYDKITNDSLIGFTFKDRRDLMNNLGQLFCQNYFPKCCYRAFFWSCPIYFLMRYKLFCSI